MNTPAKPTPTAELQAVAALPDALHIAATLQSIAAAAMLPQEIGKTQHVLAPRDWHLHDLTAAVEKAEETPRRATGTIQLKSLESFIAALDEAAASDRARVYADPDALLFVAVLNDHTAEAPGWRDHRITYKAELTPEARRWLDNNGPAKARDQMAFAEFVEDNIADIQEPHAQQLLTVATTISATTGIEFKAARRLQDGQAQLQYVETIDAKAGADGALTIPKTFDLGLRLFKNGDGYKLTARLKYRLGGGGVKFWYELERPERAIEDAFRGYVARVSEESGYLVLIGVAG